MPSVIVMPIDAPKAKMAATIGYGAEVIKYDRVTEDRAAIAAEVAKERNMTLIPPYDHEHVMAGQGTVALEICRETDELDALLVCVGGGGLLSGCSVAAKELFPNCRVIGVEPETGNDVQRSMELGEIVQIATPDTICDGAQTQVRL